MFLAGAPNREYCSTLCRDRDKSGWVPVRMVVCTVCGGEFPVPMVGNGSGGLRKYCSLPCRRRAAKRMWRKAHPQHRLTCAICGQERWTARWRALSCGSRECLMLLQSAIISARAGTGLRRRDIPDAVILTYVEMQKVGRELRHG